MVICGKKDLRWNGVFDQEWHLDAHRLSMLITYVFCLVICIGKVVTRRACGWRTRQFSAFATTFSATNSSSKVDQKFFPCICSTSWYIQEPSSAHQFSFYSIFHAFRPFFREVFYCVNAVPGARTQTTLPLSPPQSNMAPPREDIGKV